MPSVDLSSQKMISVCFPISGMRSTASATFPSSFRHGTITETLISFSCFSTFTGRATITWIMHNRRSPGSRAKNSFISHEIKGIHLGKSSKRYLCTGVNPVSFRNPSTSFSLTQFGSTNRERRPILLANSKIGCHH